MNKYTSNCSKVCVLEVDLESSKELPELQNDYSLALDKIKVKREMLSQHDLYNIPIGNVKRLVPNFFDKERHELQYEN